MSALAVCNVLYYPHQSLHETLAEKISQKIKDKTSLECIPDECPLDQVTATSKDESSDDQRIDQIQRAESLDGSEENRNRNEVLPQSDHPEPQTSVLYPDQPDILKIPEEPETDILPQPEPGPSLKLNLSEINDTKSIQVLDEKIPVGSVSWRARDVEKVNDGGCDKSVCSAFDSARSVASFAIEVTEENLQKSAEMLCRMGTVIPAGSQETVRRIAHLKTEHRNRGATMKLLLDRGADPNASTVPMPVIFLAIKAAHVEGVRRLLEYGARTDLHLSPQQKGLYPLHIAAGLPGAEGPQITELLLHALADPDVKAQDADEVYELDEHMSESQSFEEKKCLVSGPLAKLSGAPVGSPEGGRTPLHVACQRDSDYNNAQDVVVLLLSHRAETNHLWSGHSPLSLAIASGNILVVDELLTAGADPNLPLTHGIGSALCTLANIRYHRGPEPRNQINLLEKLIKAGADVLMPVLVGDGHKCALGTVVDYAHHAFQQDQRLAHTPYHALSKHERIEYNARRQLLSLMGAHLRQAAIGMEQRRVEEEERKGIMSVSPTDKFEFTRVGGSRSLLNSPEKTAQAQQGQRVRKPLFKYCYHCGRSVGVVLTVCSRCREVFYCSKNCKTKAWDEIHKDECIRKPAMSAKTIGSKSTPIERRLPLSAKDVKAKTFRVNVTPEIHECDPNENYSFI